MLANQIEILRRELTSRKLFQEKDSFYVESNTDPALAEAIVSHLQKNHPAVNWKSNSKIDGHGFGVLLTDSDFFLNKNTPISHFYYIIIFTAESESEPITSRLNKLGFAFRSELSLFELEYLQNEKGRQAVDLDQWSVKDRVFERLVREGMNPVHAHATVDETVKDFRKLKHPKLLIFDKITD